MNWINVTDERKPYTNRPVICYCPDWSDIGYQVAQWDGKEFYYEDQPNDMFNRHVKSWALFMEAD